MSAEAEVFGGSWSLPGRRVLSWRRWDGFAAGVYDRGDGEGVWHGSRHRLVYSLTPRPAMQLEGRRLLHLEAEREPVGFYPAGITARTVGPGSRYAQLCWDPGLYDTIAPDLPGRPDLDPAVVTDPLVGHLVSTLVAEIGAGTLDRLLAESLVAAVAIRIVQRSGAFPDEGRAQGIAPDRLRRVLEYIEANLGRDLSLAELAGVACLSPCHFSRRFKAAMGAGPQRHVTRRRVERAKETLALSGVTLASVAAELGFADQSHFTNVFRRETGLTPARFRAARAA